RVRDRPLVLPADALEHRPLAVRRINLLAGLALNHSDGQDVPGPLIQELDDLRVELVDGLAMIGNVHSQQWLGDGFNLLRLPVAARLGRRALRLYGADRKKGGV